MVYLFDVPAYFILLRETLEVTIILAVLLGFIDKLVVGNDELRKKLRKQVWIGTAFGFGVTLVLGAIFITVFYTVGKDFWEESEAAWEGAFSLIASIVITLMALSMVRVQRWKKKWETKLKEATERYLEKHERGNRWALIFLPFTVICREGLESLVFIAGIGFQNPASGLPIPVITGILTGFVIGYLIYKGSHKMSLNVFFGITTVFLFFVSAGLFSFSVHELQEATGTYEHTVWKLDCCNPNTHGFWGIMKTLFGWTNKATVGTTVSYFVYWIVIGLVISFMLYKEKKDKYTSNDLNEEVRDEKDGQATVNVA